MEGGKISILLVELTFEAEQSKCVAIFEFVFVIKAYRDVTCLDYRYFLCHLRIKIKSKWKDDINANQYFLQPK